MDDIGSFLYILIILVSVVFSAFKKSKRKPVLPTEPQNTNPIPDPLEEFKRMFDTRREEPLRDEDYFPEVQQMEMKTEDLRSDETKNKIPDPSEVVLEGVPQTFSKNTMYSRKDMDKVPVLTDKNKPSIFVTEIEDEIQKGAIRGVEFDRELEYEQFDLRDAIVYDAILNRSKF